MSKSWLPFSNASKGRYQSALPLRSSQDDPGSPLDDPLAFDDPEHEWPTHSPKRWTALSRPSRARSWLFALFFLVLIGTGAVIWSGAPATVGGWKFPILGKPDDVKNGAVPAGGDELDTDVSLGGGTTIGGPTKAGATMGVKAAAHALEGALEGKLSELEDNRRRRSVFVQW